MLESEPLPVDVVDPAFERIVPRNVTMERLPTTTSFGEGPVWNARGGYLLWTDAFEDRILRWAPGEPVTTFLEPTGQALALTYDREGRLVATGWASRNVWRMEPDGRRTILASHYQGKRINTCNDLVVRSDGAIYWTDPHGGLANPMFSPDDIQQYLDFQGVFRLSPDGSRLTPMLQDDFGSPNGLAFSPDESILYVNDIQRRTIRAYDVQADGSLTEGRLFYEATGEGRKSPDGMKVDGEGNVYCTGPGGIHVVDRHGKLLGRILLAAANNMCFGEDDWKTFFVTETRATWRVRLNFPGVPV
jgi:gluconolactonase